MGSTATSDAQIAELQRKLGASKQNVVHLENQLSAARAAAAAAKMQAASAKAAAAATSRPSSARPEPLPPPPPPPPPPQPQPPSPSVERLKVVAEASKRRVSELEEEMRSVKDECSRLRAEVKRLQEELSARPDPNSRDRNAAALQRVSFNLERTRAELEEEKEKRRSAERRLEDLGKNGGLGGPLRVPEPPPPKKEVDEKELRAFKERRDEETRRKIAELDRNIGKLEHRKQTHEERLEAALKEANKTIETLQKELKAAKHVAVQRSVVAMSMAGNGGKEGTLARTPPAPRRAHPVRRAEEQRPPRSGGTSRPAPTGPDRRVTR